MPCDTRVNNCNSSEYKDVLLEIRGIIACHSSIDQVIIGGDFNTDIRRHRSNNTKALFDFCESECMEFCLKNQQSNVDFTYENIHDGVNSIIDHFVVSHNLYASIEEYVCYHDGDNLSDHCPLMLQMNITVNHGKNETRQHTCKLAWSKATAAQLTRFKLKMTELLRDIDIPF